MIIPNVLTISRIILTPVFAYLFLQDHTADKRWAAIIYFIASLTDWLDGFLARRMNYTTRFGQFMDPVADKILVSTALAIFSYLNYIYFWLVFIIIFRDLSLTGLRIYALHHGKVIITSSFAKGKTFFQMIFVFVLLIYINIPGLPDIRLEYELSDWLQWPTISAAFVTLLTFASGIHYVIHNKKHLIEIYNRLTHNWR
jgi:CDP-diacylglycerol--glycerol-3-phosphate 3-phosphatidyltransferase